MSASEKPKKNGKKRARVSAGSKIALSPQAQRGLVNIAAEHARANPVFEIRGVPVALSAEHHDVLVAGLAFRAQVYSRAPAIPVALGSEGLARLADGLAASEARGSRGLDHLPPLPVSVRTLE